jgi:thioredoxin-like negative regulator of GroEL
LFYETRCKSCQKFGLKFDKLASQHGGGVDKEGVDHSVRFAAVEWGANTALCKSLGVKKLPTTMLYSQGKKVTSLTVGPSRFTELREAVERYATFSPAEFEFEARLEQGKKLMEETARRERFEEVAKARRRPTRSRMPSIPPQATVLKAFSTPTPSTGSSEGSSAVDQLRSRLDL